MNHYQLADFWHISSKQRESILLDAIAETHAWHYQRNRAYHYTVTARGVEAATGKADLPRLLEPIARGEAEYVKGDRLSHPEAFAKMPFVRYLGNHILSRITRFASGYSEVLDSQCGYTALSASALKYLQLDGLYERYGFPNDILAHLHTLEARLDQVEVRPVYGEETSEISLYNAVVGIPLVLLKSYVQRRNREGGFKLLAPQGDRF